MAQDKPTRGGDEAGRHEQARKLAEGALEKYAAGHPGEADRMVEKAKKIDRTAVVELVEELEEDAGSDPKAAKRAGNRSG